jgi:hypothetical protein
MSGTWLTGEKKIRDIMTSLLLSEKSPPDWGLNPELAIMVGEEGHFCSECSERGQPGSQPCPQPGPCPLCKGNQWRSKCPCLQIEGEVPPPMDWWVPASCPHSTSWHQCWGASWQPLWQKTTDHFPARQWSSFLCLTFLSRSPVQWQGYCSGQIWPAPRVLLYLAFGLLLGRPPLLSLSS